MQPTPGDVHVNTPLTNISVAMLQAQAHFVASQVFPNVPVTKQSDRYWTIPRGHFNRDEMKIRALAAESEGVIYEVDSTPTYYCPVYALHHDVPDQTRSNADSVLDLDRQATELLVLKALLKREKVFAANYLTGSVWGSTITGVSGTPTTNQVKQWNDDNADPIGDVLTYKTSVLEKTGFEPNTLVVGQAVHDKLVRHPDIMEITKYGGTPQNPAVVTPQALASIFGVERYLVMKAIENTSGQGIADSHSFIGGKKALLVYSAPNPGLLVPTGGYTFSWTGYLGAGRDGQRIKKFRMEPNASDRVEIEIAFDQKLVAADLGVYFASIVA